MFLQWILCSGAKDEVNERCGGVGRAQDGGRRTRWQSLMRGSAIGEEGAEIQQPDEVGLGALYHTPCPCPVSSVSWPKNWSLTLASMSSHASSTIDPLTNQPNRRHSSGGPVCRAHSHSDRRTQSYQQTAEGLRHWAEADPAHAYLTPLSLSLLLCYIWEQCLA